MEDARLLQAPLGEEVQGLTGRCWAPSPARGRPGGAAQGERALAPTLTFSMRMLVLCPLVPSVLWPLPALRMLPMLPSLPTLFLSPAAGDRRGDVSYAPGLTQGTEVPGRAQQCQ